MTQDFTPEDVVRGPVNADTHRGWSITWDYGFYTATGPDYDASYEGEEDGWVDNGHRVSARTRDALIIEVDAWFEEHGDNQTVTTTREDIARALYEMHPAGDQETDLDGRPTGPGYVIRWDQLDEYDPRLLREAREDADKFIALLAIREHLLTTGDKS